MVVSLAMMTLRALSFLTLSLFVFACGGQAVQNAEGESPDEETQSDEGLGDGPSPLDGDGSDTENGGGPLDLVDDGPEPTESFVVDEDSDDVDDRLGVALDLDGDGIPDPFDLDLDGFPDGLAIDTDGDGLADAVGLDTDGDGIIDALDQDGDGQPDVFAER